MKILIFIEHDVMIRHFIDSGVFNSLIEKNNVLFVFPEKGHKRVTKKIENLSLNAPYLYLNINNKRQKIWKRLFQVDLIRWKKGSAFKALRIFHREMIGWKATLHYSLLGIPFIYSLFKSYSLLILRKNPNEDLQDLINDEKPDLLIHPSVLEGLFINDLIEVTKDKNLSLVLIMNSWDNPSTKRSMIGEPDYLLVWGEQTRKHAIEFAGIDPNKVVIFGAAQFDVYKDLPKNNRDIFCKKHNISPEKKILLYAGSSKGTDEYKHLRIIDEAIENGIFTNLKVVYRPHPWGGGGKGGERILKHSWINISIESTMKNYLQNITNGGSVNSFPDYHDTHDVLSSVDIVVSPLSTILLEAAMHAKPTLCFLPTEESNARHFQLDSSLKHFEDLFKMEEFLVAKGYNELIPMLENLIEKSEDIDFINNYAKISNYFVKSFEKSYKQRLVDFCELIVVK